MIESLLTDVNNTEQDVRLLNYYHCLVEKELHISTSNDKLSYIMIDECRNLLQIEEGIFEASGDRPKDPDWSTDLGKKGVSGNTDNKVTQNSYALSLTDEIRIFPNPATTELNIHLPENASVDEITMTDITGKQVLSMSPTNAEKMIKLSVSLNIGIYFLEVKEKGQILKREKFVLLNK
jgi:hypothetical protein